MKQKCCFCKSKAEDSIEFECGNGANSSVAIWLCTGHLDEYEKDEYAFHDKYADQIEGEFMENLISYADSLRG